MQRCDLSSPKAIRFLACSVRLARQVRPYGTYRPEFLPGRHTCKSECQRWKIEYSILCLLPSGLDLLCFDNTRAASCLAQLQYILLGVQRYNLPSSVEALTEVSAQAMRLQKL